MGNHPTQLYSHRGSYNVSLRMPREQNSTKKPKVDRLVVDTKLLNNPAAMSELGRTLLRLSRKAEQAGTKAKTLKQIHRELAMQNGEV